jgi:hypothetical protein
MSALAALQAEFARYLLDRPSDIAAALHDCGPAALERRLDIYRHGYGARLREALANDFPKLAALAGETGFTELAAAYVAAHPSRSFSLRRLGGALPAFLAATPPWSARPVLAAMAAFEAALADAFDAADAPALTPAALAGIAAEDWPGLRLVPHPTAVRLCLPLEVPELWRAIEHGGGPDQPATASGPGAWLVWRWDLDVRFRLLPPEEEAGFDAMAEGADFAALCEAVAAIVDEDAAPLRVVEMVQLWAGSGLLAGLLPPGSP